MAITVVTGPPCSGKTTYVQERARIGDIIIDLDAIAHALTSADTPSHQYASHIRRLAMRARWSILRDAVSMGRQGCNAWIIDSAPSAEMLREYRKASARVVELDGDTDELVRRAASCNRPAEYEQLIRRWKAELTVSREW